MPFLPPNQQRQCTESKLDLSGDKVLTDSVLLFDKPSVSVEDLLQYNRQVKLDRVVRQLSIILPLYTTRQCQKGKGSPCSITEHRVPELILFLGSQPAGDVSHKPGGRLPLLSARPAVTLATLKRAATNFAGW